LDEGNSGSVAQLSNAVDRHRTAVGEVGDDDRMENHPVQGKNRVGSDVTGTPGDENLWSCGQKWKVEGRNLKEIRLRAGLGFDDGGGAIDSGHGVAGVDDEACPVGELPEIEGLVMGGDDDGILVANDLLIPGQG